MNSQKIKELAMGYYPYLLIPFIVLAPLFLKAMYLNSYSILYAIYFFLLIGIISLMPFKKIFVFFLVSVSLPILLYRIINKKNVGLDDISSIFYSNFNEASEFILSSGNYFIILIPLLVSIFLTKLLFFKKIHFLFSMVLLVSSICSLFIYTNKYSGHNGSISRVFPINLYKDYRIYKEEILRISDAYKKFDNDKLYEARNKNISTYLVIGESSRLDHYSICKEYKKNATPILENLSKREGFISYCNAKSVALNTRHAVTSMLSSRGIKEFGSLHETKNIIHVFNNFGLSTSIFENNSLPEHKNNIHKSLVLANFIPARNIYYSKSKYDLDFMKEIMPILKRESGSLNIIHLSGNHVKYDNSYPDAYLNNISENPYYKSIRYTDEALSYFIERIEDDNSAVVIYLSDHGEYVNDFDDKKYGHGMLTLRRYNDNKEILNYLTDIPFFLYMNKEFLSNYQYIADNLELNKNHRISQDNLFHTIYGIINSENNKSINSNDLYDQTYDLSSSMLKENKRYVYNSDINYNILNSSDVFISIDSRP